MLGSQTQIGQAETIMTDQTPPPLPDIVRPITRRPSRLAIVLIVVITTLVLLALMLLIKPFKVPARGGSMMPTILPHDRFYVERLTYLFRDPQRGEIVVFRTDGIPIPGLMKPTHYFKRVAGIPGDRIRIEPPNLIVNGKPLREPAIFNLISSCRGGYGGFSPAEPCSPGALLTSPTNEVVLGEGEFYVLGDNVRNSLDSRYWGPVPLRNIVGRVVVICWPPDRIRTVTVDAPPP